MAAAKKRSGKTRLPYGKIPMSEERISLALQALSAGKSADSAAVAAGISRSTLYEWKASNRSFNARWAEAVDIGIERLEDEAHRRAVEGVLEPVFGRTESGAIGVVGGVRKYSDRLLEVMLRAKKPDVYRENKTSVAVAVHVEQSDARARLTAILDSTATALAKGTGPVEIDGRPDRKPA